MREGRQGAATDSRLLSMATGPGLQSRGGIFSRLATRLVSAGPHHNLGTVTLAAVCEASPGTHPRGSPVDSRERRLMHIQVAFSSAFNSGVRGGSHPPRGQSRQR